MIEIRQLKIEDVVENKEKLVKYLKMVLTENLSGCNASEMALKYYQDMVKFSEDGSAILIGAFDEENLVGFHWGYEIIYLGKKRVHSYLNAIEPQYRGNHIGSNFFRKLEEIALERNIFEIEAMCSASNETAVQYHFHNGFEIERYKVLKKLK